MSAARTIGYTLLGALIGAVAGGALGLGGGLGWNAINHTSNFEGLAGYVIVAWMLIGILIGLVSGVVWGLRRGRRSPEPHA